MSLRFDEICIAAIAQGILSILAIIYCIHLRQIVILELLHPVYYNWTCANVYADHFQPHGAKIEHIHSVI